jgi:hypothetical protein
MEANRIVVEGTSSFFHLFMFVRSTAGTTMGHEIWNKSKYVSNECDTCVNKSKITIYNRYKYNF